MSFGLFFGVLTGFIIIGLTVWLLVSDSITCERTAEHQRSWCETYIDLLLGGAFAALMALVLWGFYSV